MDTNKLNNKTDPNQLVATDEIIKLAKESGVKFGFGDAKNRIRYLVKNGLLPHQVRKVIDNKIVPQLPYSALARLIEIQNLQNTFRFTVPQLVAHFNDANVKTERAKYELDDSSGAGAPSVVDAVSQSSVVSEINNSADEANGAVIVGVPPTNPGAGGFASVISNSESSKYDALDAKLNAGAAIAGETGGNISLRPVSRYVIVASGVLLLLLGVISPTIVSGKGLGLGWLSDPLNDRLGFFRNAVKDENEGTEEVSDLSQNVTSSEATETLSPSSVDVSDEPVSLFGINLPVFFSNTATFDGDVTFQSGVNLDNQDLDLGVGSIFASNVIHTITSGDGVQVSAGQNPILTNTGVLSIGGQAGDVELDPGDGIEIDGTQITNIGVISLGGETGDVELTAGSDIDIDGLEVALQPVIDTVTQINLPANSATALRFGGIGLGSTGSSAVTSGASLLGFYDNIDNSASSNLQLVISDIDTAIGDRVYAGPNFVTSGQSLTESISALDSAVSGQTVWVDAGAYVYTSNDEILGNPANAGIHKIAGMYLDDNGPLSFGTNNDFVAQYNGSDFTITDGSNVFVSLTDTGANSTFAINRDDLFVKDSGSVGIGTTAPVNALDVIGSGQFTGQLTLGSIPSVLVTTTVLVSDAGVISEIDVTGWDRDTSDDITSFLNLTDTPNSYAGSPSYFVRVNAGSNALEFVSLSAWDQNESDDVDYTGTARYIPLWGTSSSLTSSVLYQETATNYVGIGTTDPERTLDVTGGIGLTDDLYIGNIGLGYTSPLSAGAYLIGVYDEFTNSDSTTLQDVLDDLDSSIAAAGHVPASIAAGLDYLSINGPTQVITLNQIDLAADITGLLATANGGLGANITAAGSGEILYSTGATTYASLPAGNLNQILISGGTGAPDWDNITTLISAGDDIDVTGVESAVIALEDDITLSTIRASSVDGIGFYDDGLNLGVYIVDGGSVGIGRTSPAYKLDVNGTGRFSGNLTLSSIPLVADNSKVLSDNSGVVSYIDTSAWDKDASDDFSGISGTDNRLARFNAAGDNVEDSSINDLYAGGVALTIDAQSDIGIGVTATNFKLDVGGTANVSNLAIGGTLVTSSAGELNVLDGATVLASELNYLDGTTVVNGGLTFGNGTYITQDAANLFWDDGTNRLGIGTTAPESKLTLAGGMTIGSGYTGIGISAPANGLLVQGNVGIGVTATNYRLDVGGTANVSNLAIGGTFLTSTATELNTLTGVNATLTSSELNILDGATVTFTELNYLDGTTVVNGGLTFGNGSYITQDAANLFWDDSTNRLGIGTTAPQYTLDVNGDIRIVSGSDLYIGDIGIGTSASAISSGAYLIGAFDEFTNSSSTNVQAVLNDLDAAISAGVGSITGTGVDNYIPRWNGTDDLESSVIYQTDAGNIGIGTTATNYKLDVGGTANVSNLAIGGTQITSTAAELNILDGATVTFAELNYLDGTAVVNGGLTFGNGTYITQDAASLFWDDSANRLGIGTTAPTRPLEVYKFSHSDPYVMQLSNSGIGGVAIQYQDAGAGNGWLAGYSRSSGTNGSFVMSFNNGTPSFGSSNNTKFILTQQARLGIGVTSAPTSGLAISSNGAIGSTYSYYSAPTDGLIVEGSVGIGTTSPSYRLDVAGTTQSENLRLTNIASGGANTTVLALDGSNNVDYIDISGYDTDSSDDFAGISGTDNRLARFDGAGTNVEDSSINDLYTSGVALTIDATGDIGIGITATNYKLSVGGTANVNNLAIAGTLVTSSAGELNILDGATVTYAELNYLDGTSVTNGGLTFGNGTYITQDAATLFWNDSANRLGIGTTAPQYALEVTGTGRFGGQLSLGSVPLTANNNQVLTVDSGVVSYIDTSGWDTDSSNDFAGITGTDNRLARFNATGDNVEDSSILDLFSNVAVTIGSTGNLGIGTTAPESKLTLAGGATIGSGYTGIGISAPLNGLLVQGILGIGVTATNFKLDVGGTANVSNLSIAGTQVTSTAAELNILSGATLDTTELNYLNGTTVPAGAVMFGNGTYIANDQPNLFFNNSTKRLGIGTSAPGQALSVAGTVGIIEGGTAPQFYTVFRGQDQSADITYTLPPDDGSSDYVLATDGAGVLTWKSATGVGAGNGDITAVIAGSGLTGGASEGDATLDIGAGNGITVNANDIAIKLATTAGVGSTASFSGLEVDSDGLRMLSGCGNAEILGWDDTNNVWECTSIASAGGVTGTGVDNYIPRWNGADDIQSSIIYQTDGGNVGIGTTAPESKLTVAGGATFGSGYTGIGISAPLNGLLVQGNVGIGLTATNFKLDVGGTANVSNLAIANTVVTSSAAELNILDGATLDVNELNILDGASLSTVELNYLDGTTVSAGAVMFGNGSYITNDQANFYFNDTTNRLGLGTTAPESKLTVAGGATFGAGYTGIGISAPLNGLLVQGSVGIGTTNPAYKLDVSGDIRAATGSDFYVGSVGLNDNGSLSSGASLIGVYDNSYTYISGNTTVQGAIADLDSAIGSLSGSTISAVGDVTSGDAFTEAGTQGTSLWFYDAQGRGKLTIANLTGPQTYTLPDASGEISLLGQTISNLELDNSTITFNGDSGSAVTSLGGDFTISGGTGIGTSVGGTAITITNTDLGSSQNIFKNVAVSGQNTVVAEANNDTLTLAAGTNVTITTNDGTDTVTINAIDSDTTYTAGNGLTLAGTTFKFGGAITEPTRLYDGSYEYLFINPNTGNLGIGTTNSTYKLEVNGTLNATTVFLGGFQVISSAAELNILDGATVNYAELNYLDGTTVPAGAVMFGNGTYITNDQANFYFNDTTNRLGLGTTAPESRLTVAGGATFGAGYTGIGISAPLNGLLVQGNVGIGTTNPGAAIDVVGNGVFSGTLGVNGAGANDYRGVNMSFINEPAISYGLYNTLDTNDFNIYGLYNDLTVDTSGEWAYGVYNDITLGAVNTRNAHAIHNEITGGGNLTGVDNTLSSAETGAIPIGINNSITVSGTSGTAYGTRTVVTTGSGGTQVAYANYAELFTYVNDRAYGYYAVDNSGSTGGTQYGVYVDVDDVDTTNYSLFVEQGSGISYFGSDVGIGTSSPSYALEVTGTGRFGGQLTLSSVPSTANNSQVLTVNSGVVSYIDTSTWDTDSSDDFAGISGTDNRLARFDGAGTNVEDSSINDLYTSGVALTIDATGDIGIGITATNYKLDVGGTANVLNLAIGGTLLTSTATELNYLDGTTVVTGGLTFGNGTYITQDAANLFWDDGANRLGIGTTAPQYTLDVNGSIRIASGSDLYIGNIGLGFTSPSSAGALLVGAYDEFTNSNSITVQDVLDDLDAAISGSTHDPVTLGGGYDYLSIGATVGGQEILLHQIDLATDVTGLLATANGGLGANVSSAGAGEILYSTSTTAYDSLVAGTMNQVLISGGTAAPSWSNITSLVSAGDDIDVTGTTAAVIALEDAIDVTSVSASSVNGLSMFDDGGNLGVFVEDGGNVGIGTTNPIHKLDVSGNIRAMGNSIFGDASGDTVTSNAGAWTFANATTMDLANSSTTALNIEAGLLNLDTQNGRVGIGTTAPGARLHIKAAAEPSEPLRIESATAPYASYYAGTSRIGWFGFGFNATTLEFSNESSGSIQFRTNSNTVQMSITNAGRVGIGTTAPASKLAVSGGTVLGSTYATLTAPTDGLLVQGNVGLGVTAAQYKLDVAGTGKFSGQLTLSDVPLTANNDQVLTVNSGVVSYIDTSGWDTDASDDLAISGTDNRLARFNGAGTNIENSSINDLNASGVILTIDASGNVGIGVTASTYKLNVSGSANFTSLYLAGTQVTSNAAELNILDGVTANATELNYLDASSANQGGVVFGNGTNFTQDTNNLFWNDTSNFLGIGTTAPVSMLSVGPSSQFQINSTGNIVKLNNVTTSFPSSQGGAGSLLTNDGAGTLTWAAPSGTGTLGYWQRNGTNLAPANIGDSLGIGTTAPESKLTVAGGVTIGSGYTGIGISAPLNGLLVQGNLGIGNTNPTYPLDVTGVIRSSTSINAVTGLNTGAGAGTQRIDASGNLVNIGTIDMVGGVTMTGSGVGLTFGGSGNHDITASSGTLRLGAATLLGSLIPSTDDSFDLGSNTARFKNLYLGPATLHIGTSTSDEFAIGYDTTSDRLEFNVNGSGNAEFTFDANGRLGIGTTSPESMLTIAGGATIGAGYTGIGISAPLNGLLVQGNVGIGTTDPSSGKLVVDGGTNTAIYGYRTDALTTSTSVALSIGHKLSSGTADVGFGSSLIIRADNAAGTEKTIGFIGGRWDDPTDGAEVGKLFLGVNTSLSYANADMVIDNNGLVGIGTTGPSYNLDILSTTTTGGFQLTADAVTSGTGANFSFDGLTDGTGLNLASTSNVLSTGSLVNMEWIPSGTAEIFATGDLFKINLGQYANIGNIFALYDNDVALFKVSQTQIESAVPHLFSSAGDVSIANDLQFTNQTAATIKSDGPLTIESGESFENLDLTLKPSGSGSVVIDDGSDLELYTGESLIFDTDDGSDTYLIHDSTNDRLQVFVDASERFRFDTGGNSSNGAIATSLSDLAESYPTMDITLEPGDVVVLDKPTQDDVSNYMVARSNSENKDKVLGVVSSKPGLIMGGGDFRTEFCALVESDEEAALKQSIDKEIRILAEANIDAQIAEELTNGNDISAQREELLTQEIADLTEQYENGEPVLDLGVQSAIEDSISACKSTKQVNVALAGRVPVKYDSSNGEIKSGDLLAVSDAEIGKVMKVTKTGWVVGRALEDSGSDKEMIMMFANLSWYTGETQALAFNTNDPVDIDQLKAGLADILEIQDANTTDDKKRAVFFSDMNVMGNVTADSFSTLGEITAGFLTIDGTDDSISVLGGGDLKLQSGLNPGNIDAFNGALVLTSDGGIIAKADITADTIAAKNFTVLGAQDITEDPSVGEGIILAGTTQVVIPNINVKAGSKVFVTATTDTNDNTLVVSNKIDGSFTVTIKRSSFADIKFDYWVLGVQEASQ